MAKSITKLNSVTVRKFPDIFAYLANKNEVGATDIVMLDPESLSRVESGTTAYWNSKVDYIPPEGALIIYTDYYSEAVDGETVYYPNIKVGSGNGYVQDLVFIGQHETQLLLDHITNLNIHVTSNDKLNWNNKLNIDDANEVINEILIFNRN